MRRAVVPRPQERPSWVKQEAFQVWALDTRHHYLLPPTTQTDLHILYLATITSESTYTAGLLYDYRQRSLI